MKKVALCMTYIYFLICPLEFILNRYFGSSVKYIAIAAAAFMLMFFIGSRRDPMKFGMFQICIISWALLEAASYLWTIHSSKTLSMLITYMMMAVLVFAISIFPFEKKHLDNCLIFYMLGCLILSILLLTTGEAYEGRLTIKALGAYQDPNGLSALLLSGAFFALYKTFKKPERTVIPNILFGLCFATITVAVFATGSRGALVAYAIALFIYSVIVAPKNKRWQIFVIVPIVIIALYFILSLTLSERAFDRLFDFDSYSDGGGRVRTWTRAMREIFKRPLFGHGILSHQGYFYQETGRELSMHNTFLFIFFEVGIVGLILFIFPYIKAFIFAAKNKNAMICAIIIANIIAAFFLDALNHRYLWNAMMFGIVYYNINNHSATSENKVQKRS